MFGSVTRSDFEHCEVGFFLGKNPWHSHSIPRARVTLKEIAKDPKRTLIVVDPRRTETAEIADIHLQVRPGTDASLLTAMLGVLVQENLVNRAFVDAQAVGLDDVVAVLKDVPVAQCCARAGVDEALVRKATRVIAAAQSMASMEDLGVQMSRDSTLVSYLHHLLVALTGNIGKQGSHYIPTTLVNIAGGASTRSSPVAGARIVAGLVPCNVIAEEILSEHPKRYRAMIVEAANPAHSLADSVKFREALQALDCVVVIDVAMSETARLADYVLPACTQFEKAEATFFNFEFPKNAFQLRPRLFMPPDGPLPEAEIHARLVEALGAVTADDLAPLLAAAKEGPMAWQAAFMERVMGDDRLAPMAPVILYRTLPMEAHQKEGAVLLGLALKAAMQFPQSLARAGFDGDSFVAAEKLFTAMLEKPEGVVFAIDEWSDVLGRINTPDKKIHLALPDLLAELQRVVAQPQPSADAAFPFVLSAGERRSFTANTIMRDPAWRKKDTQGALRVNPADAAALGVQTGGSVKLTTKRGSAVVSVEVSPSMQPGHVSLPNGLGLGYPVDGGADVTTGVAPNDLTSADHRDAFVGTPLHKFVPARLERLGTG